MSWHSPVLAPGTFPFSSAYLRPHASIMMAAKPTAAAATLGPIQVKTVF
jgi:hypothetical protein